MDLHQANLLLFNSPLHFNPTPTFIGVTYDHTLSFIRHISSLKAQFFPLLKALRCISGSSWGPSKKSLSLRYRAFLWPLLTYASPGWFPFLASPIKPNWNAFTKRLVAPSPAASRGHLSYFSSLRCLYLLYELP